jgi:ribosomal protein S6--L-glutamate ligase
MKRTSRKGEFRSNLHRGGRAEAVVLTDEERVSAIKAADAMGLNVAGVDMLRSTRGTLVLEVNPTPGIEGMEGATGVDVASAMIDLLEQRARPGATQTKGSG